MACIFLPVHVELRLLYVTDARGDADVLNVQAVNTSCCHKDDDDDDADDIDDVMDIDSCQASVNHVQSSHHHNQSTHESVTDDLESSVQGHCDGDEPTCLKVGLVTINIILIGKLMIN